MRSHFKAGIPLAVLAGLSLCAAAPAQELFASTQGPNTVVNDAVRWFSPDGTDLGRFVTNTNMSVRVNNPRGLAFDASGNLYVASSGNGTVRRFSPDGTDLGIFAGLGQDVSPIGLAFDASGNLYVNSYPIFGGNSAIRRFSPTGEDLGNFAITGGQGTGVDVQLAGGLAFDAGGNLYASLRPSSSINGSVRRFSPDGADLGIFATGLQYPEDITFDTSGNLYVASFTASTVRRFSPTGADLGIFASSGVNNPIGLAFDASGNLYVANYGNATIRRFSPDGTDLGNFAATGPSRPTFLAFGTAAIPEPGSFALFFISSIVGAGSLLGKRRRS